MDRLSVLIEWLNAFRSRLAELAELDTLDDAQRAEWGALDAGYVELDAERVPLQERSERLAAVQARGVLAATGDGALGAAQHRSGSLTTIVRPGDDEIYDRSNIDARRASDGQSYRDRAMWAIDSWRSTKPEWKESAARLVEMADDEDGRTSREIADHILRFGNPLYVRAFKKFLRGGTAVLPLLERDEAEAFRDGMEYSRAVNEGSVAAGQAIVPPFLDPTIILTNVGAANPFRQISTVRSITTQTWKGVTSAGVSAEWTAEASEMTDASPSFQQPTITPVRADAYIQASFEVIEDTSLATDVAMLFADARDRLESTAFAVGTGSTQPTGVVTALNLVTASRLNSTTNGSIGYIDLLALDSALPPRFRTADTKWTMAHGIQNIIRALPLPSSVNFSPWVDFGGALPAKLIGYELYEASGMQNSLSAATASTDDIAVLGDFRQGFYIVDRIGLSVAYNPLVLGANRRPTGEVGWAAFWRVGSNVVNPAALQMLVV